MTDNERLFVESIVNHTANVHKSQEYINENFKVNSEYDPDDNKLYIWTENVNESLNIIAAKEYLLNNIGEDKVEIIYGMKGEN